MPEPLAASERNAQAVESLLQSHCGRRIRLTVSHDAASLEYTGRVPRSVEVSDCPAGQRFGVACLLTRPGSLDPANPISPQAHFLRSIDGEWFLVRVRLQDSDPLEMRRLGPTIRVNVETLS